MAYWMNDKIWFVPWGADSVIKLDWLDPPLPYIGVYLEGIRMILYHGKIVRYQDIPFWKLMRRTGPYDKTRHKGMQLENSLMLVVLDGTNTMSYSLKNEKSLLRVCFSGLNVCHFLTAEAETMKEEV